MQIYNKKISLQPYKDVERLFESVALMGFVNPSSYRKFLKNLSFRSK